VSYTTTVACLVFTLNFSPVLPHQPFFVDLRISESSVAGAAEGHHSCGDGKRVRDDSRRTRQCGHREAVIHSSNTWSSHSRLQHHVEAISREGGSDRSPPEHRPTLRSKTTEVDVPRTLAIARSNGVIIGIRRGTRNKYEYDRELHAICLNRYLTSP
jgi:hypothetical protein